MSAGRLSNRRAYGALAAILLLAAVLRLVFFVGLVGGDPQDDGVYYNNAFALASAGPRYFDLYRNFSPEPPPNPINSFHVRPMVTYPIAALFTWFGPGEVSAATWGFVCSLLTVLVTFWLGVTLHDKSVGLLAALLCAFYPLEVINGTRILSDVQVGLFCALALTLLVAGDKSGRVVPYWLSGVSAGAAYLANARGLTFLAVLIAVSAVQAARTRPPARRSGPLWIALGFGAILSVEASIYFLQTGDPLFSYHIQGGAARFKYLHEPVTSVDWGWLRVSYTNGRPFELLRSVLHLDPSPKDQFGYFFVLFFIAAVVSLVRRRNVLLVAVAGLLCLFFEFGPVQVSLDTDARELHYMMVFKQERFLLVLTAPFVVLSAWTLRTLASRSRIVAIVVVVVLFVTSISAIVRTREFYRAALNDMRAVAPFVLAHHDRTFSGDLWAVEYVRIFTRHRATNLRVLDPSTSLDSLRGECIMLGGSRGVELLAEYVETTLPPFARQALRSDHSPVDWQLVFTKEGARNAQRLYDFRVYCLPLRAN